MSSDLDQWRQVRDPRPHECCSCVDKLLDRINELQRAQAEHIETHRREALLGHPTYDRRGD